MFQFTRKKPNNMSYSSTSAYDKNTSPLKQSKVKDYHPNRSFPINIPPKQEKLIIPTSICCLRVPDFRFVVEFGEAGDLVEVPLLGGVVGSRPFGGDDGALEWGGIDGKFAAGVIDATFPFGGVEYPSPLDGMDEAFP